MVDAESKVKKGRIRHCYPRKEVYHRWIHDSEYVYSNQAYAISGKGNYLRMFDIGKHRAVSDIESNNQKLEFIHFEAKEIESKNAEHKLSMDKIAGIFSFDLVLN